MTGSAIDPRFHDAVVFDGVLEGPAYESALAMVRQLHGLGIRTAVLSSSGGAAPALEVVHRLGAEPARAVVVTVAAAGVSAGRRAGFGLVVGVARSCHRDELRRCGAHVVVTDISELDVRVGDQHISQIPDALTSRHRLTTRLRIRRPAIFLDFDGTLADIVRDPAAAVLVEGMASVLADLARRCPVAVISGRDLTDVRRRIGLPGIWYAGSHGFELVGPDGQYYRNPAALAAVPILEQKAAILHDLLGDVPGIMLEHKRFTIAVHYRNVVAHQVEAVVAAVGEVAAEEPVLRVTGGHKVVELCPDVEWDKGCALEWILDHIVGAEELMPIYIGDDLTDEDAFDAVADTGLGIAVRHGDSGDRRSAAQLAVDDPTHVRELLGLLADLHIRDTDATGGPDTWMLTFDGYDPATERLREALCTVGNGSFATRGCAPESSAAPGHYPGTYAAGIYNRLRERLSGRDIDNESLVNLPNWLATTFRIEGGAWFDIDAADLLDYHQCLDLRRAVLTRTLRFRDEAGRTTTVVQRRFVAMHLPDACALETTIRAENWSGGIEFRSVLDGTVRNTLVERYRDLADDHLQVLHTAELSPDSVLLVVSTNQSRIPVAMAARHILRGRDAHVEGHYRLIDEGGRVGHDITVDLAVGHAVTLEKIVTLHTGRDHALSEPGEEATRRLPALGRFDEVLTGHILAWEHLWDRVDIELGDDDARRIVRLHLLQILQTVSPHSADLDVGVPARGLHGEAYRGHIFWDELFVFPVLNLRLPMLTRSLLRYRYRRLPEARRAALAAGRVGAMFPWQSGSDGREESQQLHLNPQSGHWNPDTSWRQYHIGIAIAFNMWQYYQVTGDLEFLTECGAEMLVEVARFYVSLASYDRARRRYSIRGVMGPDEFHSGYPEAPHDGIDNNAYTNVMAVWVILRALDALEAISPPDRSELVGTLNLEARETARWLDVSRNMFVPFHDEVISQFEGYDELDELDWSSYRERYDNIQRLDRILEAEGDDINRYRASKQADVLLLFYLLSADELRELLGRLGYRLEGETIPRTIDYYLARTSHGSTLSAVVHSWVLARANRDKAMEFFDQVLASDITDIQGGTTPEGIHLAAMAGSVDLLQRCFSGLETRGNCLVLGPQWPETLGTLEFPMFYRGHRLWLKISGRQVQVSAAAGHEQPITIVCRDERAELRPGGTVTLG